MQHDAVSASTERKKSHFRSVLLELQPRNTGIEGRISPCVLTMEVNASAHWSMRQRGGHGEVSSEKTIRLKEPLAIN